MTETITPEEYHARLAEKNKPKRASSPKMGHGGQQTAKEWRQQEWKIHIRDAGGGVSADHSYANLDAFIERLRVTLSDAYSKGQPVSINADVSVVVFPDDHFTVQGRGYKPVKP